MGSVAIDAYALGTASRHRGIGTYVRAILEGFADQDNIDVSALASRETPLPVGVRRIALGPPGPRRMQAARHDLRLPGLIRRSGCAVFHSPAQSPPARSSVPWLQTLLDLTPLVYPHPELEVERRRWLRIGPRLRQASAVICISQSSADQGIGLLGLDPSRVHVVHLGVDARFRPGDAPASTSPYLLMVAAWGPHKGFREAIAAAAALRAEGYPHRLVIAGHQGNWGRQHIASEAARYGVPDQVEVLDYVDDLVALYRGAEAVLVPSHAEGFGLPAVEAMACGVPVIAADATSLPEVVGDAGMLVPAGDVSAWCTAVRTVVADPVLRADLALRGPERASHFSWAKSVSEHVEIVRSLM